MKLSVWWCVHGTCKFARKLCYNGGWLIRYKKHVIILWHKNAWRLFSNSGFFFLYVYTNQILTSARRHAFDRLLLLVTRRRPRNSEVSAQHPLSVIFAATCTATTRPGAVFKTQFIRITTNRVFVNGKFRINRKYDRMIIEYANFVTVFLSTCVKFKSLFRQNFQVFTIIQNIVVTFRSKLNVLQCIHHNVILFS